MDKKYYTENYWHEYLTGLGFTNVPRGNSELDPWHNYEQNGLKICFQATNNDLELYIKGIEVVEKISDTHFPGFEFCIYINDFYPNDPFSRLLKLQKILKAIADPNRAALLMGLENFNELVDFILK